MDGGMKLVESGREREMLVPVDIARRSAEILRAAGADLSYIELDTGHKRDRQGMDKLSAWWRARAAEHDHRELEAVR
jgi:predicted esterase